MGDTNKKFLHGRLGVITDIIYTLYLFIQLVKELWCYASENKETVYESVKKGVSL